jgi:hypothetical protein
MHVVSVYSSILDTFCFRTVYSVVAVWFAVIKVSRNVANIYLHFKSASKFVSSAS